MQCLPVSVYELNASSRVRISCYDVGSKDISYIIVPIKNINKILQHKSQFFLDE